VRDRRRLAARRRRHRGHRGPGLAAPLLVGVAAAKALALSLGIPIHGVNHLAAHVPSTSSARAAARADHALLVSAALVALLVPDVTSDVRPLGRDDRRRRQARPSTRSRRVLGLPFPGGPHIDRAASEGSIVIDFPRGLTSGRDMERHRFDFSFSGLKTAVARWVEAREAAGEPVPVADVAASFQEAVSTLLTRKALLACERTASSTSSSAAASRPTRGCGRSRRCGATRPGSSCACRGRALHRQTARWSRLGAELVARGARRHARPPGRLVDGGHDGDGLTGARDDRPHVEATVARRSTTPSSGCVATWSSEPC